MKKPIKITNPKVQNELFIKELVQKALKLTDIQDSIQYLIKNIKPIHFEGEEVEFSLLKLCDTLRETEKYENALIAGEYIYKNYPKYSTGRIMYARTLADKECYQEAIKVLEEVNFRGREDMWHYYCRLLDKINKKEICFAEIEQFTLKFPKNTLALYRYAMGLKDRKCIEASYQAFDKLLTLEPNNWKALLAYAHSLQVDQERYNDSIPYLEKALAALNENIPRRPEKSDIAKIYHQLGLAYAGLVKNKEAALYYNLAIKYDPRSAAGSSLTKLDETDRFLKQSNDQKHYAHFKGEQNNLERTVKQYERTRKANPERWDFLHDNQQKIPPLVSMEYKHPEPSTKPASQKNIPTQLNIMSTEQHKKFTAQDCLTIEAEINQTYATMKQKHGDTFTQWYEQSFVCTPSGESGLLQQAEALQRDHNYSQACQKLNKMLSELNAYTQKQLPVKTTESEKLFVEEADKTKQYKNDAETKKIPQKKQTNQKPFKKGKLPAKKEKEKQYNTSIKQTKDNKKESIVSLFWKLAQKCCPPFGKQTGDSDDESSQSLLTKKRK